jgi:hypothetical protein
LFGALAEEKEVKQILSKVMEARRSKSYDSYEILGKFVGKDQVTKLILPLKEVRTCQQYNILEFLKGVSGQKLYLIIRDFLGGKGTSTTWSVDGSHEVGALILRV